MRASSRQASAFAFRGASDFTTAINLASSVGDAWGFSFAEVVVSWPSMVSTPCDEGIEFR
jgi:hypothetical protein